MGHSRSQRHLREIRGTDSNGVHRPGYSGPAITGFTPTSVSIAAAGAVGRTVATITPTGGTAPFSYAVSVQAGVAASFSPNTSNLLKTLTDPCAIGPGLSNMQIQIVDSKGKSFTGTLVVTRT